MEEMGKEKRKTPQCNGCGLVDHPVSMRISVSKEELEDNINKKSNLAGDVQEDQVLRQSSEESELHGREKGRVNCP